MVSNTAVPKDCDTDFIVTYGGGLKSYETPESIFEIPLSNQLIQRMGPNGNFAKLDSSRE